MGTPASASATWGARRMELTRASTATEPGVTPGSASQPSTTAASAAAPPSASCSWTCSAAGSPSAAGPGRMILVDPAMVVRQQVASAVDHGDGAPVVDLQRVIGGTGEQAGEVDQERGISAGVPVDHLVVVADTEHVQARCGQEAHQQHVGRREILQLVHQQVPAPGLRATAQLPVLQEQLDGAVDLLVEVDGAAGRQPLPERAERGGQAGHVVPLVLHLERVPQAEPDR